jgi:hypothetical protein
LELPGGGHSANRSLTYHTPSPKPSPGKGKPLAGPKKKLSSSSPGEHEGYYPCNKCGRYEMILFVGVASEMLYVLLVMVGQSIECFI